MPSDYITAEKIRGLRNKGMSEFDAVFAAQPDAQGLGAVAKQKKEQEEAQKAASGEPQVPPKSTTTTTVPADTTPAKPKKGVPQMPKDELDALRIAEQKKFEERRKAKEAAK